MEVDDIFGYDKLVATEKANLQAGMNYREGKDYSIVLMSVRKGAPYADAIDPVTGIVSYEGHDVKRFPGGPDPKRLDQPLTNPGGSPTENGKFFRDAIDFKTGRRKKGEASESLREDFARNLELQRFLRVDRREYRIRW